MYDSQRLYNVVICSVSNLVHIGKLVSKLLNILTLTKSFFLYKLMAFKMNLDFVFIKSLNVVEFKKKKLNE